MRLGKRGTGRWNSMKKIGLLLLLIAALLGLRFFLARQGSGSSTAPYATLKVGEKTLRVEVARTPPAIEKGLGYRDTLGSDGMLFLLPVRIVPTFWMKGMRFPLDFIWIDGNKVVDLTANVPAEPGVPDATLKLYSPKSMADKVLEVNAGKIGEWGIKVGDEVY